MLDELKGKVDLERIYFTGLLDDEDIESYCGEVIYITFYKVRTS